uniref:U6 snRNA phosphodiesterase-like n=1 Tax=Styela clava TaxID=7725 RepID=UPI00193ABE41|nr:U6 snRNA phosphodiesterase-like [Styela clava]
MGSLKLLSAYDTSSDSDGENEELSDDMKFQHQTDKVTENKRELLPLPPSVSRMFSEKHSHVDSPELHQGRKRTFPHQRGNWATFVFAKIPITLEDKLRTHVLQSLNFLKTDWTICDDFHISLSRTVSLPHHCIDPFFSELKIGLKDFKSISLRILASIQVYTNDENTRTFLSFPIHSDYNEILIALSKRIDTVFTRFRLQEYYKNPSFHISFAWICNENVKSLELINNDVGQLNHYFSNLEYDDFFQITEIICKAGNKHLTVDL